MGAGLHPTAVVEPGAQIHATATVGAFSVVGAEVSVGPGCHIGSHVVLTGRTVLGPENNIDHHAVLGGAPQIRQSQAAGRLELGQGNHLREFVTVHAGSSGGVTRLGDHNYLMAYCHVAHDCRLGHGVELANGVQLAGHVEAMDHASLGGLAAVHQFVRVGAHAFVGAGAMVSQDVLPYCLVSGDRARLYGLNTEGLRRHGFDAVLRRDLAHAVRALMSADTLEQGLDAIRRMEPRSGPLQELLDFARSSSRGLCALSRRGRGKA